MTIVIMDLGMDVLNDEMCLFEMWAYLDSPNRESESMSGHRM